MHVLVTGGAGFIGSQLCERLLGEGHRVTCLDSFDDYYDPSIKEHNVAAAGREAEYRLLRGDIRDAGLLDEAMGADPVDRIVHLAARAGPRPSLADPALYYDVNVLGTLALLQAALRHRVGGFLFVSSSSVYGLNSKMPFQETDAIGRPASPYGATKAAAELLCHAVAHNHGLPITAFRLFTVYGPRQRPDMALMKFASRLVRGEPIEVYGDGTSVRGYTYVDDVIDALLAALEPAFPFEVFNVGGGRRVSLNDLIATLGRELGIEPVLHHVGPQAGDVPGTWADVTKAHRMLGFQPAVDFEDGVARFCRWFAARGLADPGSGE